MISEQQLRRQAEERLSRASAVAHALAIDEEVDSHRRQQQAEKVQAAHRARCLQAAADVQRLGLQLIEQGADIDSALRALVTANDARQKTLKEIAETARIVGPLQH